MRGWTDPVANADAAGKGYPAHAGMDRQHPSRCAGRARLPRPCGDGPPSATWWMVTPEVTPPMRGWTEKSNRQNARFWGYPAHAGMDLPLRDYPPGRIRLPRPCGDGPYCDRPATSALKVTPPMRGWTRAGTPASGLAGGYPAHAGMDPPHLMRRVGRYQLPRPCGDGPETARDPDAADEVTPPMRGWTIDGVLYGDGGRGYPAHAGMDPASARRALH